MTDTRADTVSIVDRTHPVAAGAPVVAAHFLRHTAVFVLGEEAMLFVEPDGEPRRVAVHDGAILATAADKQAHRQRRRRRQGRRDRRQG